MEKKHALQKVQLHSAIPKDKGGNHSLSSSTTYIHIFIYCSTYLTVL